MEGSTILLYVVAQLALGLLLVCIFLFLFLRKQKKLIKRFEEKLLEQKDSIKTARLEAKEAKTALSSMEAVPEPEPAKSFVELLDEEIDATRAHHQSLNPDRDIVLDITPDSPMDRQVASLRHAFLLAEKEARFAGGEDESSWEVLEAKLAQIISFYEPEPAEEPEPQPEPEPEQAPSEEDNEAMAKLEEELGNYKKRVENLEKFKKMFFEMESKWDAAKSEADGYQEELLALGVQMGGGEHFQSLLDSYTNAYEQVGDIISEQSQTLNMEPVDVDGEGGGPGETKVVTRTVEMVVEKTSAGKAIIQNQEEIERLKNMAVDQHNIIVGLKQQLLEAQSAEEQQQVVEQLSHQLEQQQRFLQEAETCTQLLEDELSRTIEENETLRKELEDSGDKEDVQKLENMVEELTTESRDMLSTIAALEAENSKLKETMESGEVAAAPAPAAAGDGVSEEVMALNEKLKEQLDVSQQELLNLQAQHIELEERYLELKMK